MTENPLQRENVASIRKEGPREAMAEDVGRASRRDASGQREAADELLDRSRSQATASSADEEGIRTVDTPSRDDPCPKCTSRTPADRDDTARVDASCDGGAATGACFK